MSKIIPCQKLWEKVIFNQDISGLTWTTDWSFEAIDRGHNCVWEGFVYRLSTAQRPFGSSSEFFSHELDIPSSWLKFLHRTLRFRDRRTWDGHSLEEINVRDTVTFPPMRFVRNFPTKHETTCNHISPQQDCLSASVLFFNSLCNDILFALTACSSYSKHWKCPKENVKNQVSFTQIPV
jgi:hypothetical protein